MGSMSTMMGTLFVSTSTSLYSSKWTPSTTAQYAGTCIFIIFLAAIFRALFFYRTTQEHTWRDAELKRRQFIVSGKKQEDDGARFGEKVIGAGNSKGRRSRPWRIRRFNTTIMGQKVVLSHVKFVGTDNVCLSGLREAGMLGFVKSQ
ncbi:MAG: hypothetical protein Q9161_002389 [Pseudevernia consocians]